MKVILVQVIDSDEAFRIAAADHKALVIHPDVALVARDQQIMSKIRSLAYNAEVR